ncbi:inner-membrane translocator [Denitrovibrio acetiphilus DSM 12809]|uniref:Inner-membrane translocator n=1 Tax=Denitrovibrio acetiphilus (strain DSM 12809 / NBRC 114555 / N2460) TaxID=522772 RepID=D4H2C0_DENA2|nr:ABC transporter permease [Denitrovibrio acetiphilus]ADD68911.1 inner-membrane translocator [Denitrovibrio acetiphilus DSM 12809]
MIKFIKRRNRSKLFTFTAPFVSVLLALATAGIIMLFAGVNPLEAYAGMLQESVGSFYGLSETLVKATPLILTGLGVSLAFRMQIWNIGAEGQLMMGAVGAAWVALYSGISGYAILPVMFFTAAVFGGLWAGVAGFLKAKFRVNEIIVTLLMNYIAISIVSFLIYGPWKDPKGFNFPLTPQFAEFARLGSIFNTRLHYGFIMALVLVLVMYIFMEKTIWGYEIRVIGNNPNAAKYAGIKIDRSIIGVLFLSGALAGVAGFSEVAGIQFRLQEGISSGYGYTAIIVAWLAGRSALGVLLVSIIMSIILVGGDSLQILMGLPVAFVNLFQGLILFFILASDFFINNEIKLIRENQ